MTPEDILARHARAAQRRRPLEAQWQDCFDHALPAPNAAPLFDATAADAAEQLAASLLAELVPPWSRWFGLAPARAMAEGPAAQQVARTLDQAAETLQGHLDRSNFALEVHQAFLELVVTGTAVLLVEEAPAGGASALHFTAVPLREAVLEEGRSGRLDTCFRSLRLTPAEIRARWPAAPWTPPRQDAAAAPPKLRIVEAAWPDPRAGHCFAVVLEDENGTAQLLAEGRFSENPFIAFRWLKVPGELYGRGPVAKALPDRRGRMPPTRCCSCRRRRRSAPRPAPCSTRRRRPAGWPAPSAPRRRSSGPPTPSTEATRTRSEPGMPEDLLDAAMQTASKPPRPAEVPEKFWDEAQGALRVDALLKSYLELERRLSQRLSPPSDDAPEEERQRWRRMLGIPDSPDGYQVAPPHELVTPDAALNSRLHQAGFTPRQVQLVYDLAAERLLPLIAEAAADFEAGRQVEKLRAHFGGEERFRRIAAQISAWGRAHLPEAVFTALASTAEGVVALHRMMEGKEPTMARDAEAEAGPDEAELRRMMRDPRYWRTREPEFVRRVTDGFRRLVGEQP